MTAFLKIYPIPKIRNIYILYAYSIAMHRNIYSCQYTALIISNQYCIYGDLREDTSSLGHFSYPMQRNKPGCSGCEEEV